MSTITPQRFAQAQAYEASYWNSRQTDPVGTIHDLESPFHLAMHAQAEGLLDRTHNRVLDVGVGGLGLGMLWLVRGEEKHGLDPLPIRPSNTGNPHLDEFVRGIQQTATYVCSQAEAMPYPDSHFDFIICNNVLDHVQNPAAILREIKRCLSMGGIFAFSVDTRSFREMAFRSVLRRIRPNYGSLPGHPHDWTEPQMTSLLTAHGFTITSHRERSLKGLLAGNVRRSTWLLRHA